MIKSEKIRLIVALIILATSSLGVYYLARGQDKDNTLEQLAALNIGIDGEAPQDTKEYTNKKYNFKLKHPSDLEVKEFDEGGGASLIVFEKEYANSVAGFQMFILPYNAKEITRERFLLDVPSGVQKDMKYIDIEGVNVGIFYSEDSLLGETVEIWFINNGYLYEITAPKSLDTWVTDIVKTLHFL